MERFDWSAIAVIVGLISAITAFLIGIVSFFIRKWMSGSELAIAEVARTTAAADIKIIDSNKAEIKVITGEIKQDIRDSRDENLRISTEIKGSIDKLVDHQAVANGRTGKLEGAIEKISTRCEERSKAFYKSEA